MKGTITHSNRCTRCEGGDTQIHKHDGWILHLFLPYVEEKKKWQVYYRKREDAVKEWLRAQTLIQEQKYYPPNYYKLPGNKFVFEKYFEEHMRPATKYVLYHLGDLAEMDIRDIDSIVLYRWYQGLPGQLSQVTRNTIYGVVKAILNKAWRSGDVNSQIPPLELKRAKMKQKRWYTREEQLLVISCMAEKYRSFFEFLAYHGCRENEALKLTWAQVDAKNRTACLDLTKTNKENLMPLYSGYELPEPKVRSIDGSEKVFPQVNKTTLWRVLQAACRNAGLEPINVHEFSVHSFTSQKEELGFTSDQVAMTLNKTPEVVSKHYSHARMKLKRRVVES